MTNENFMDEDEHKTIRFSIIPVATVQQSATSVFDLISEVNSKKSNEILRRWCNLASEFFPVTVKREAQ
jgi:hypothetical protein